MAFPTGWTKKGRITIDHTKVSGSANLTNFPVLLTEANFPSTIFDNTQSAGEDLRFTSDSAGTTELAFEIVNWDTTNDKAEIWVKVPTVSYTTDTVFYVWYDNATAITSDELALNSLLSDANLQGYWKMEDESDSSGNNHTLTNVGTTTFTTGKFGNAASLNGSSQWFTIPYASAAGLYQSAVNDPFTVSAWVYRDTTNTYDMIYSSYNSTDLQGCRLYISQTTNTLAFEGYGASASFYLGSDVTIPTATWTFVCAVRTASVVKVWVNGVKKEVVDTNNGSITIGSKPIAIGVEPDTTPAHPFDGLLDDVAYFNRALTDDEVMTLFKAGGGVWSDAYSSVWHFENNTNDSSIHDLTLTNSGTSNITSKIGDGRDLEASLDTYLTRATNTYYNMGTGIFTLSCWFKPESDTVYGGFFIKATADGDGYKLIRHNDNKVIFTCMQTGGTGVNDVTSTASLSAGNWYKIVAVRNADNVLLYLNDGAADTDTSNDYNLDVTDAAYIGAYRASDLTANMLDGVIDEMRVIKGVALSAGWIATEYNNQNSPATFASMELLVSDERSAKLSGKDSASSERSAKLSGYNTTDSERSAKLSGYDTASDERSAKLTGFDTSNDERQAKISGYSTDSAERSAKITGTGIPADSERASKLFGKDTSTSEMSAKIHGKDTSQDSRSAKTTGGIRQATMYSGEHSVKGTTYTNGQVSPGSTYETTLKVDRV